MKSLLIWLWLSQSADISTTAIALHRGCVEKTYWSGNPDIIAAGKLGATVTFTFGLPKDKKASKAIVGGFAAAATTAAVLNARTMRGCQ